MSPRHLNRLSLCAAAIGALAIAAVAISPSRASEEAVIIPPPAVDVQAADGIQTAVIAGGCFWGVQGVYQHTAGVLNAVSGYSGGSKMTANYSMIGTGTTGHAESVEIKYDPKKISYGKILQIFFSVVHDPTQLNRQGPDTGTQYRSAIFTANDEQKKVAEAYHQDYLTLHPNQPYIAFNDIPKVENLKKIFAENYIEKPTLVSSAKVTN